MIVAIALVLLLIAVGIFVIVSVIPPLGTVVLDLLSTVSWMPDWVSAHSFFSWVLFIIAMMIVAGVCHTIIRIVSPLVTLIITSAGAGIGAVANGKTGVKVGTIISLVLSVVVLLVFYVGCIWFLTDWLFGVFAPYNSYYADGGIFDKILHVMFFWSFFLPGKKSDSEN